ncbi:hypothetical protein KGF57_003144 [Candida theae]|uniref:Alpha/beta hydrolase fold-3 domain-containing protein n=1 Tax=Candida theae TaxID=1198502 RepID=A0AAD5BD82_9ASCO|nr:uncharacterized protein KGF57_003144 [Candida theae]KAI5957450.1 hypothetical protein KGF57_003144 [Candida theae]
MELLEGSRKPKSATMLTPQFIGKLCTLPYPVVKIILQYYTVGTIYSKTNKEFKHSLYKNILVAMEAHMAMNLQKSDMKAVCYEPINKLLKRFKKTNPMSKQLNAFGEKFDECSYWIHKSDLPKEKTNVVVYMHGGGYLLNMIDSQLAFSAALHFALDDQTAAHTSILIIDYSLTMFDHIYPTQLYECLRTYSNLVKSGYTNITLMGDSAGAHMSLSLARAIAYPEEVKLQFDYFSQFNVNFNISDLPQPIALILDAPWVQPCTPPLPSRHHIDTTGDIIGFDVNLGHYLVENLDQKFINNFLKFTNTNWDEHWAKVDAINNGNTLIIVGEREVLRDGMEDFYHIANKSGSIQYCVEPGGIHAGMVYIESLDYMGKKGGKRAIRGEFNDKFGINLVSDFLNTRGFKE